MKRIVFATVCLSVAILSSFLEGSVYRSLPVRSASALRAKALPWFTGSLFGPSTSTIPVGSVNVGATIEYALLQTHQRMYAWNPQLSIATGVTRWMDLKIGGEYFAKQTRHEQSSWLYGDTSATLGFQLHEQDLQWPAIKLSYTQVFPTGRYRHLNPRKHLTDTSGEGSYWGQLILACSQLARVAPTQYFRTTLGIGGSWFSPVHVEGYNSYSNDKNMKGKVRLGSAWMASASGEYALSAHWAAACDVIYTCTNKITFSGKVQGIKGKMQTQVSSKKAQLLVAPAIEYNFNKHFGFIGGIAFSAGNKQRVAFKNCLLSLSYTSS